MFGWRENGLLAVSGGLTGRSRGSGRRPPRVGPHRSLRVVETSSTTLFFLERVSAGAGAVRIASPRVGVAARELMGQVGGAGVEADLVEQLLHSGVSLGPGADSLHVHQPRSWCRQRGRDPSVAENSSPPKPMLRCAASDHLLGFGEVAGDGMTLAAVDERWLFGGANVLRFPTSGPEPAS